MSKPDRFYPEASGLSGFVFLKIVCHELHQFSRIIFTLMRLKISENWCNAWLKNIRSKYGRIGENLNSKIFVKVLKFDKGNQT